MLELQGSPLLAPYQEQYLDETGDFYSVALSSKAGHNNFMGDNLKERAQTEHCVCKRKGKWGHPFTEFVFCALFLRPSQGLALNFFEKQFCA